MSKAKRRIHSFNFKDEGCHVALVDKAANLQEVLVMKAQEKEVTVTLSMREFLQKFFNMWSDEAAELAGILGYSTGYENQAVSVDEYINGKVEAVSLLKSEDTIPDTLPESIAYKVLELQKQFEENISNTSKDSPSEEINVEKEKGESVLDTTEISVEELEVLKSQAKQNEEIAAQLEELKVFKAMAEDLKKEKEERAKQEMTDVVKGYSFVPEEASEKLVAFLMKSEGAEVILDVLEKARDAISATVGEEAGVEAGSDETGYEAQVEKGLAKTAEILKSRSAKAK